jgi:hypothetical protein
MNRRDHPTLHLRHKLKQRKGLAFLMLSTFHRQTKGPPQREVLVP